MSDSTPPATPPATTPELPLDAYYDSTRRCYLIEDTEGNWMSVDKESIKLRLARMGYCPRARPSRDELISEADLILLRIQNERNVTYSCNLAGFRRGTHYINESKILVTRSPRIIESTPGPWPNIRALIDNQLEKRTPDEFEQNHYFHTWLKLSDTQLRACVATSQVTYGQALIFVGPRGCGKSLLQLLIGEVLGGRTATPFAFMSGATPFNSELFACEHQMIEDEQPHKDMKSRVRFGDAIKSVTATLKRACYGKNKEGQMLTPFWRLTLSVNDEPQHVEVLPPFTDSLLDKIILLYCRKEPMPMPAGSSEEKALFWTQLTRELPHYLHWLRHEYVIPESIRESSRYGLTAFLHPYVMTLLSDLLPETRFLALIDHILFMDGCPEWPGTAEELTRVLVNDPSYGQQAKSLINSHIGCGRMLGALARSHPQRFKEVRSSDRREWIITAPPNAPLPAPLDDLSLIRV